MRWPEGRTCPHCGVVGDDQSTLLKGIIGETAKMTFHLLDPEFEETLVNLSLLLMIRGQLDEALRYALEGWRLNRDSIPNYVHLGHVYRERGEFE